MTIRTNVLAAAAAGAFLFIPPAHAELQGDSQAIQLAEQMIESIGGAGLWANIRTLYVVEKSRNPNGDGVIGTFWRDLETSRERYTLDSRTGNVIAFWWDERGVYQTVNGRPNTANLPENIHQLVLDYWPGEIYVMYHRLAKGDPGLRLELSGERDFTAYDAETGDRLGRFWINAEGDMYRWRHGSEEEPVEYIYGPHKEFGEISFPEWGTQVDGSWMFEYVEVRWSAGPPPVSFDPPSQ